MHCIVVIQCNSDFCVIKSNERKKRDVAGCYSIIGTEEYLFSLFIGIYGTLRLCFLHLSWIREAFLYHLFLSFILKSYPLSWHWPDDTSLLGMKEHMSVVRISAFFPSYYREILQILKIKFSFYFTKSQISFLVDVFEGGFHRIINIDIPLEDNFLRIPKQQWQSYSVVWVQMIFLHLVICTLCSCEWVRTREGQMEKINTWSRSGPLFLFWPRVIFERHQYMTDSTVNFPSLLFTFSFLDFPLVQGARKVTHYLSHTRAVWARRSFTVGILAWDMLVINLRPRLPSPIIQLPCSFLACFLIILD